MNQHVCGTELGISSSATIDINVQSHREYRVSSIDRSEEAAIDVVRRLQELVIYCRWTPLTRVQ